jgi:hypothetical protein
MKMLDLDKKLGSNQSDFGDFKFISPHQLLFSGIIMKESDKQSSRVIKYSDEQQAQ